MKKKILIFISRTLKLMALVLPLACLIHFGQEKLFYYEDYNTRRIEQFYEEEENSLDVVVVGASETFAGFAPGYAYEMYGFTSYLYAQDSNTGSVYKASVKEIMNHQDPQVILVDIYGFLSGEGWEFIDETRVRMFVESIPFSLNKVQTILEHPLEHKISYFVPFVKYHGELATAQQRLAKLDEAEKEYPNLKGIITQTVAYQGPADAGFAADPDTYQLSEGSREWLVDFLEYCRKENLDNIVFVNFPRLLENGNDNSMMVMVKRVEEILNEYAYPLLDLQNRMDEYGLDVNRDFYNMHHLNVYGMMKVTEYLGTKLVGEYGVVPTVQSEENRLKWEECVLNTRQFIQIADAEILYGYDMFISEENFGNLNVYEITGVG